MLIEIVSNIYSIILSTDFVLLSSFCVHLSVCLPVCLSVCLLFLSLVCYCYSTFFNLVSYSLYFRSVFDHCFLLLVF